MEIVALLNLRRLYGKTIYRGEIQDPSTYKKLFKYPFSIALRHFQQKLDG
jgi:hypothetical protein